MHIWVVQVCDSKIFLNRESIFHGEVGVVTSPLCLLVPARIILCSSPRVPDQSRHFRFLSVHLAPVPESDLSKKH